MNTLLKFTVLISLFLTVCTSTRAAEPRPLTVTDVMQFKEIKSAALSEDGKWLSYIAQPDRGDSSFHVISTTDERKFNVDLGSSGQISADGKYAASLIKPSLLATEQASKKAKKQLKNQLQVIHLNNGAETRAENVESYQLSDVSGFVAFIHKQKDDASDEQPETSKSADNTPAATSTDSDEKDKLYNSKRIGFDLTLINLATANTEQINDVDGYAFSPKKDFLVYSLSTANGEANGLYLRNLTTNRTTTISKAASASFEHLSWNHEGDKLAFIEGKFTAESDVREHQLRIYNSNKNTVKTVDNSAQQNNWFIASTNKLTWSDDDKRLFFGFKPVIQAPAELDTKPSDQADLYNIDKLVEQRDLQIWHGNDALIKTNEKYQYQQDKKAFFTAVYHLNSDKLVQLADQQVINVTATNNKHAVVAKTDLNYRRLRTWEGFYADFYIVDLANGKRHLIAEKLNAYAPVAVSPSGRYAAYYDDGHYWLFDKKNNQRVNLTERIESRFANEDHDYPSPAPGYGVAGWLDDNSAFLVYDKFDIWQLSINGKASQCLTCDQGRVNNRQFRITRFDDERLSFQQDETLLLTSYHDKNKNYGFYQLVLGADHGAQKLVEENKKYRFLGKAKDAEKLIFSREDFQEFPDLWVADLNLDDAQKLTNVNPQIEQFAWGNAELVDWLSADGQPHQGILIKPANYVEGEKYPVLVYYYRLFSQRMYEFNQMKVNHRPNFPLYSSNGYAIFLPDVHFQVGTPGASTNKSILPGLQKLIDMGVADEHAIGLHGHSWSGYQTLFAITETDMFAAAVSGAPVANMTSAYSGIRLGTGLARQFQYEMGQSRMGASMFERRDLYIENSPVFFADRINTPLLMQFGDIDDAVPWQQGVEMYLAMRRLDKDVILLQYEGEPHHLKKYPNKVDYTIKMMQYFDHYLKGEPAPKWMTEGEAYFEKPAKDK